MELLRKEPNVHITDLNYSLHGHAVPSGSYMYHGRMLKSSAFVQEYVTSHGRFSKDEWVSKAWESVVEDDLVSLYEKVYAHVANNCYWLKNDAEKKLYSLQCMASEAWKAWNLDEEVQSAK